VNYLDTVEGTRRATYTGQTSNKEIRERYGLKKGRQRHYLTALKHGVGDRLAKFIEFCVLMLYGKLRRERFLTVVKAKI